MHEWDTNFMQVLLPFHILPYLHAYVHLSAINILKKKNLGLDFWRSLIFSLWSVTLNIIWAMKGLCDLFTHVVVCNSFALYLQREISEFTSDGLVLWSINIYSHVKCFRLSHMFTSKHLLYTSYAPGTQRTK